MPDKNGQKIRIIEDTMWIVHYPNQPYKFSIGILQEIEILKNSINLNLLNDVSQVRKNPIYKILMAVNDQVSHNKDVYSVEIITMEDLEANKTTDIIQMEAN